MNDLAYPDAFPAQHRLHWYVLEQVLGQGGFGITYLARDTNLDQMVAIKEYLPGDVATRRPDGTVRARTEPQRERYRWGLDRFIREARTLARFDHSNIVRVLSVFELNDTAYMVMRFEAGDNLGARLDRRGVLPEDELLRILLPVLDGLELVHSAGFIHRDVKPDNIHIRDDGTPVLLDFGSARHALGKARTLTILVAPGYAPFEQYYSSSEDQGPWTDIYGLGATCYRAIAGTAPLDSIARSKGVLGSTRDMLVPAQVIGKGRYSDRLLAAIDHALEFAEKDRPQTVAEWRAELTGQGSKTAQANVAREPIVGSAENRDTPAPAPVSGVAVNRVQGAVQAAAANEKAGSRPSNARVGIVWACVGAAAAAVVTSALLTRTPQHPVAPVPPQTASAPIPPDLPKKGVDEAQPRTDSEPAKMAAATPPQSAPQPKWDGAAPAPKPSGPALKPPRKDKTVSGKGENSVRPDHATLPVVPPMAAEPVPSAVAPPAPARPDPTPAARPEATAQTTQQEKLDEAAKAVARGDYSTARGTLEDLARRGNSAAQMRLADMHANGQGTARSAYEAYVWYSLAVRCGNSAATAGRSKMASLLQAPEIQLAEKNVASMKVCSTG